MTDIPDYLVVYGDSYSDIQAETKRTNGPVWSQQLASQWNAKLLSFAQPGATFCKNDRINGSWLEQQVERYSSSNTKDGSLKAVHTIFLGVTELMETKGEANNINKWIQCIKEQVALLCSNNPESKVIVMGVPALEFSPYAMIHKSATKSLKQNIIDFNVALEEEVLDWQDTFSNNKIVFFDTYLVFSDLLGDPSSIANIDNVDNAFWDNCLGKCNDKMDSYLWWDTVHITGAGHKAISNTIQAKEFFDLKALLLPKDDGTTITMTSSSSWVLIDSSVTGLSWIILGFILIMILYMIRHNRVVVSLKKMLQTKAAKVYAPNNHNNNNHEYSFV